VDEVLLSLLSWLLTTKRTNRFIGSSEFDAEMSFQGVEIRLTLPKFLPMPPIGREYSE
jgi:hypothetical protein